MQREDPVPGPGGGGLSREVGALLLTFYGLGITIGAGIYVLVGEAAVRAGVYTPLSFLLAALVMLPPALCFAELGTRLPRAAGEAAYVEAGFGRGWLTLATGLAVAITAVVAGAAIARGAADYIQTILPGDPRLLTAGVVIVMGAIASRGVRSAVGFAAILTALELGGLATIIIAGVWQHPAILSDLPGQVAGLTDPAAITGVMGAAMIAFFAFVGFDSIANMAEEVRNPATDIPRAIFASLAVVTVVYVLVAAVAVRTLDIGAAEAAEAPIRLMFERLTGLDPLAITLIAIIATVNGVVVEILVAARILYGLGAAGRLPGAFARVGARRHVPTVATAVAVAVMLVLAVGVPLGALVELTSTSVLIVFILVSAALWRIKRAGGAAPEGVFTVPGWVPPLSVLASFAFLLGGWLA